MKTLLTTGVVFSPGSRNIDFSGVPNFDLSRLYGVINATANKKLYAPGIAGYGYTSLFGSILTLEVPTTGMAANDELLIVYDPSAAVDVSATSLPLPTGAATQLTLEAIRQLLTNPLKTDGTNTTQPVSASSLPLPSGAARDASLQDILTALRAQRVETIWTDDTGVRFIRNDAGGTISWTTVSGAASSAPGSGARPDSDSGVVVSRTTFRATASGTGFASGDILDHLVVTDGDAGDLISNFWINVTSGAKITAPSSASITPLSPLPDGAATSAKQDAALTSLGALSSGVGAPADTAATSDGGTFGIIALMKRGLGNWTTLLARIPTPASGRVPVDGSGVTQPVSATSLPLPANAAQDGADPGSPAVANAGSGIRGWLATIAGLMKPGAQTKALSGSVTIATDQGNLEPGGTAITGTAMPAGGIGLTGWLSAIWSVLLTRSTYSMPFTAFGTTANGGPAVGAAMNFGASPSQWARVRASCVATATGGTFNLQGSNDGFVSSALYLDSATVTTPNVPVKLEAPAQMASVRIVYVPGANAANITAAMSLHTV